MDNITTYFDQIKDIPLLDEETEKDLIKRWRIDKNTQARDILIQNYLRLVASVAKGYVNLGLTYDDLIQEGNLGLMYAVDTFDISYKNKMTTYATWWIRHYITRAISNQARIIRVPAAILESKKEVDIEDPLSLDEPLGDTGDETFGSTIIDYETSTPEDKIFREEMRSDLGAALATLEAREGEVLRQRFGLHGGLPQTLEEIGNNMKISKERVRQIERNALRKMRHPMRKQLLMEYI